MRPGQIGATVSTSIGLAAALAFLGVTSLAGDYAWVARIGGAGWVFLLSMIILLPTVAPWFKRRMGAARSDEAMGSAHH